MSSSKFIERQFIDGVTGSASLGAAFGSSTAKSQMLDHQKAVYFAKKNYGVMQQNYSYLSPWVTQKVALQNYVMRSRRKQRKFKPKTTLIAQTPYEAHVYDRRAVFLQEYHDAMIIDHRELAEGYTDPFADFNAETMKDMARTVDEICLSAMIGNIYFDSDAVAQPTYSGTANIPTRAGLQPTTRKPDIGFALKTPAANSKTDAADLVMFDEKSISHLRYIIRKRNGGGESWCITLTPEIEDIITETSSATSFRNKDDLYTMGGLAWRTIGQGFNWRGFTWVRVEEDVMPKIDFGNLRVGDGVDRTDATKIKADDAAGALAPTVLVRDASIRTDMTDVDAYRGRFSVPGSNSGVKSKANIIKAAGGLTISSSRDNKTITASKAGPGTYLDVKLTSNRSYGVAWLKSAVEYYSRPSLTIARQGQERLDLSYAPQSYVRFSAGGLRLDEDGVIFFPTNGKLAS